MRRWHAGWSRLRDLLVGSRVDREIDDELRFHIEEEIEAGICRGLTPAQAREAAYKSLGAPVWNVRKAIQDARGVSVISDFQSDVRQGLRLLRRAPVSTAVMVYTLAIAIGGSVTAFSVADVWLFRPLRFPAVDRLVVAFMASAARPAEPVVWMPYRTYPQLKASARAFSSVSAVFFHGATWRTSSDARSVVGMRVTPEFFATMGVPALRGRHLGAADVGGPPVIVLSYGFWQRELGGAPGVVGRGVTLSDVSYTVVGVMPADFDIRLLDSPEGAAYWTLIRPGERGYDRGGMGPVTIVARLADGVTVASARAEVAAIVRRSEEAYPINFNQPDAAGDRFVVSLSSLQADNTRTVRSTLLTVLGAAVCLLVIAALNVGVMLLGRGLGRSDEVAVRHALGARRGRLVRQFLTESLVLSACGAGLGIAVGVVGVRVFETWNPLDTLPATGLAVDGRAVAAAVLAMVLTTIVAGLVPAIRLSTSGIGTALPGGGRARVTAPAHGAQRTMLVAQIAMSTVLLVCAGLLARTVIQLRNAPLGFTAEGLTVAEVSLPATPFNSSQSRNAFYRAFEERLHARPGIRAMAAATTPPLVGSGVATVNLTATDSPSPLRMSVPSVSAGYFDALDIPIVTGRTFDGRDSEEGHRVAVLNARAATGLFGDPHAAIGKRLRIDDEGWREVVGVVGNVRTTFFNTLEWRTEPMVYRPVTQALSQPASLSATHLTLWVHVRADRPLSAEELRHEAAAAGPRAVVLSVERVPDLVAGATKLPTFRMTLLLLFCGMSLLLAAIGVYGVVTQAVTERRREIAIRLALGAEPHIVTTSFVRTAVVTGGAGLTIGVALSIVSAHALESMLYGVRASDAMSLASADVLLLAVTSLAAWIPALRATRVDAAEVLRA